MLTPARQVIGFDATSIVSILWLLLIIGSYVWFYNIMKRMERTLEDIKKQLQNKSQPGN